MAQKETNILKKIQVRVSELGARMFRNQVGKYRLENGRYVSTGLYPGSSDLIGWTPITITEDMVGQQVAVFTAIEVKTDKGRVQDNQTKFINAVANAGGYAGVARCDEDAEHIISPSYP